MSVIVIFTLPILTKFYLNAEIGIFPLLLIIIAVAGPAVLYRFRGEEYPLLGYVAAAALAVLGLCILVGILITPVSAYMEWFGAFVSGAPQGGVGTIFVLLITLFSIVIAPQAEKRGALWPFLMLSIVVFYLLTIIVQEDRYLLILVPLFGGAAVYYVVRRVPSGARLLNSIFAVSLVVVTLISAGLFPDFAKGRGSEFVNNAVFPTLRKTVVKVFPRFPLLYTVPGYGISFDESRLGSRPNLIDDPLFEVEGPAGETLYLRTRVFDTYNGTSWSMSTYFADTAFARTSAVDFISSDTKPPDKAFTLSMVAKSFFYLPHTLSTRRVYFEDSHPSLKGGTRATGFELSTPFKAGAKIHLQQDSAGEIGPETVSPAARARYLQIPEDLPEALRTIAEGVSRGAGSKAEILARIEAFLAYNYTYSIDIDDFMYSDTNVSAADFAYAFLFEQTTGYCVHFATSFILLARLAGVPARYATGFLARIPRDETMTTVTGLSAHAWPEVWLEGSGWINWEATPAANAANYTITGNDWLFNLGIDLNPATARQLERLIGGSIVDAEQSTGAKRDRGATVRALLIVVGSLTGAALLALLSVRFAYPAIRYISDGRGRLFLRMRRLSRRLERKGIPRPVQTGWLAWADNVKKRIGAANGQENAPAETGDPIVDSMTGIVLRLAYGDEKWRPEASARFVAFKKHVLKGIRPRSKRRDYSVS